jgi:F0F1-type ATP synthase membrane subunit c/vacuolar-type H+-ATPase subunit K
MATYVAKQWNVQQTPNERGNYVEIVARAPGLMGWLLQLMGIGATTSLYIDDKNFTLEKASLAGHVREVVPLKKISSTTYGFVKPWKGLIMGLALAAPTFGVSLVVAAIYYFLYKTLTVGIKASGGVVSELNLKNKGLGGNKLTDEHAQEVSNVIQMLIDTTHSSDPAPAPKQLGTDMPARPAQPGQQPQQRPAAEPAGTF